MDLFIAVVLAMLAVGIVCYNAGRLDERDQWDPEHIAAARHRHPSSLR